MLTLDKIYHAAFVLKEVARKTDLIVAPALSGENTVYLKTENLQVTGSFKLRGSYYKISQLTEEEKERGIIACSAGNHAQGVALASQKSNIPCLICMPDGAPISKVEATKQYGAEVCLVKDTYDDAYAKAIEIQKEEGKTLIHPFDDDDVIAGQGTIGLEILDQLADADAVIVPIGGGGLISGVSFAIKSLNPNCKVYGVQAAGAASMYNSVKGGELLTLDSANTFADGIAVKRPGDKTFELISTYVDDIATVSDDEIAAAILALMEKQKLVSEGAGAVSVAAAMFNKFDLHGKKIVCLVSGGNIDVNILNRVITRGLIMSGRRSTLTVALVDKPGQLLGVSEIISHLGGNVIAVHHDSSDPNMDINSCFLRIVMETRDEAQVQQIKTELISAGFHLV
ncbi:threonine ammonia-lyase [Clostridium aminobutyricum]|uniref:L-threonine dehydratase catabolic TdcB n=1 Tax=Clostridium aminobutyricum TaxID=33953 RepID=A0A939IKD9_CLOAM|nr:threonine ammonia-lyase [Clostridium aminobutyricum]MBN7774509.1 threonine ammonia-lyase [Clostridium aminobutyricum]